MSSNNYPTIEDLLKFISVKYVIVKKSYEFPLYKAGEDVDIFCEDASEMCRQLFHIHEKMVKDGWSIKVSHYERHIHFDLLQGDKLIIRLDLIDTLDIFKKELLEDNEMIQLAFRLMEYGKCPNKIKHLEYVKSNLL